jgi:hypothetical protein
MVVRRFAFTLQPSPETIERTSPLCMTIVPLVAMEGFVLRVMQV